MANIRCIMWFMYLATRLRDLRKNKNLSGGQAATYVGISPAHVSDLENDKAKPSLDLLVRLARYYNCSTDYLLGLTDDPAQSQAAEMPTHSVEIISLLRQLSEMRRLELLRIAEALYELEQEAADAQPTLLGETLERLKHGDAPRIIGAQAS